MTCEHKLGFVVIKEVQNGRSIGVMMGCVSLCGERRLMYDDGTDFIVAEKARYAKTG